MEETTAILAEFCKENELEYRIINLSDDIDGKKDYLYIGINGLIYVWKSYTYCGLCKPTRVFSLKQPEVGFFATNFCDPEYFDKLIKFYRHHKSKHANS